MDKLKFSPKDALNFIAQGPRRPGVIRTAATGFVFAVAAACSTGAEKTPIQPANEQARVDAITVVVHPSEMNLREQPGVYAENAALNLDDSGYQDTIIDWRKVTEIEGEKYDGMSDFSITNPIMVKGADPIYDNDQGTWAVLNVTLIGNLWGDIKTQAFLFKGRATRKGLVTVEDGPSIQAVNMPDGTILGRMADGRIVDTNIVNVLHSTGNR